MFLFLGESWSPKQLCFSKQAGLLSSKFLSRIRKSTSYMWALYIPCTLYGILIKTRHVSSTGQVRKWLRVTSRDQGYPVIMEELSKKAGWFIHPWCILSSQDHILMMGRCQAYQSPVTQGEEGGCGSWSRDCLGEVSATLPTRDTHGDI